MDSADGSPSGRPVVALDDDAGLVVDGGRDRGEATEPDALRKPKAGAFGGDESGTAETVHLEDVGGRLPVDGPAPPAIPEIDEQELVL